MGNSCHSLEFVKDITKTGHDSPTLKGLRLYPILRTWAGHCVAGAGLFHLGRTTRPNPRYSPPLFLRSFSRTTLKSCRSGLPRTWRPIGGITQVHQLQAEDFLGLGPQI